MNKKAFTICLLLSLLMSLSASAAPRTRQQAMQIAKSKAQSLGIEVFAPTIARRAAAQAIVSDEETAPYFVFNNGDDKGWTLVSGDDRMPEILGYSDEGTIDMDDLPDGLQYLLAGIESYYNKIDSIEAANPTMTKVMRKASSTTTSPIGPLCVTKWDQYEPYSNNCPTVSSGKHAATCCVATAFAQILYYLYYTKGKQESTTFTTAIPTPTNTAGYKGSAVAASDRTYEWSKMLTDYAGKDYTDEQAAAIAKLMADIGSSFNVKYGTTSSSSTTDDYMSSLTSSSYPSTAGPSYWGIASTNDLSYNGSISSTDTWHTAIDTDLNKYYPVMIGGNGHAFICDGRDSNNMYHLNFGYDGRGDGFYSLDACNNYNSTSGGSMRITSGMRIESTYPTEGLAKLQVVYDAAKAYLDDEPVGTVPGYYRQEYYDALSAKLATAKTYLDNNGSGKTDDELVAFGEEISTAEHNLIDYRYPYPTGTYYLKSYDDHSGTDVVIYASGSSAKYGPISTSNDNYKWQITYNEDSNGYQIKNVGTGTYINSSNSSAVTLGSSSTVYTEITPVNRIEETNSRFTNSYWDTNYATTIRPITSSMSATATFVVISYADGTGGSTSGTLIGWQPYNDWDVWIPVPIDVDYTNLPTPDASFAKSNISIIKGGTAIQKVTTNSDGAVTYTSSDTSVATVDSNGEVTAIKAGTTTITASIAKSDNYSATSAQYTVTVTNLPVPTITFEKESLTLEMNETDTNEATVTSGGSITYSSSDTNVATVNASTGEVTGVNIGTAVITATAAETSTYSSVSATYTVTVTESSDLRSELDALITDAKTLYTSDELTEAKASGTTTKGDGLITSSSQFSSPYTDSTEGSLDNLLDNDATTYWHSTYQGGNVTAGTHYIQVALNSAVSGDVEFDITRRDFQYSGDSSWGNDFLTLKVTYSTDGTTWTDGETISTPYSASGESFANTITLPEGTLYVRVYFMSTNTGKGYSHIGEMQLYQLNTVSASDDEQAIINLSEAITAAEAVSPATQDAIDDLQAAIDDYYDLTENLKLIDKRVYLATKVGSYTSAKYTRSVSYTWGTICLPYAIKSNDDYQLYVPTAVSNGTLSIEATDEVEAGIPAIFKKLDSSATELTFTATTPTNVRSCTEGKTKNYDDVTMNGTYRRLTNQTGMYFIANDAFWKANSAIGIDTYRSWINVSGEDGSMLTIVVNDNTDAITGINDNDRSSLLASLEGQKNDDDNMYNIAGQRVSTPQKGQIVIVGGKKVLVK